MKVSEESFTRHWREHALGGFQLAQAAIPGLLKHGGESLFFTGASGSLRGKANFAPFASAKAALRNLAQSIAREYGPRLSSPLIGLRDLVNLNDPAKRQKTDPRDASAWNSATLRGVEFHDFLEI